MIALLIAGHSVLPGPVIAEEKKPDKPPEPNKADDKKKDEKKPDDKKPAEHQPDLPVSIGDYYDIPKMVVNLKTNSRRPEFLVLSMALQMEKETDREKMDKILPQLVSAFQEYLRELDASYLRGSMGMYRLKEELLLRASTVASPIIIKDALFKEILVK